MNRGIIILLSSSIFLGCNKTDQVSNPDAGFYVSNFEDQFIWTEGNRLIYGEGRNNSVCTNVNNDFEYTETMRLPYKFVKVKNPKIIKVEAWAKVNDLNSKGVLVASIKVGSNDIVWNGIDTDQKIFKPNVWTKLDVQINVPPKVDSTAIIMVYGLRKSTGEIFFDDFSIKIE